MTRFISMLVVLAMLLVVAPALAESDNNPPGSQNANANSSSESNAQGGQGGQGGNGQGGNGSASSNNSVSVTSTSTTPQSFMSAPAIGQAPFVMAVPPQDGGYIQSPVVLPKSLTIDQAQACRAAWLDDEFEGGLSEPETERVSISYVQPKPFGDPAKVDMSLYLGTVSVTAKEGYTFLPTLCEAAYRAMEQGATHILVQYHVRPINVTRGIGYGSGMGGSVVPNATQNPYTVGAAAGLGTGYSTVRVETELELLAIAEHDHAAHSHMLTHQGSAATVVEESGKFETITN